MLPSVDELIMLDSLTLRAHTEQAGDAFDMDEHRVKLQKAWSGPTYLRTRGLS